MSNNIVSSDFVIGLLNNLEDEIQVVLDASVPNKIQNRAASKMSGAYFFSARSSVTEPESNVRQGAVN